MHFSSTHKRILVSTCALLLASAVADARDKKVKDQPKDPQDQIEVVGHIALTNGPVKRFVTTQHYSSYYLYAENETGKNVTLIDVTRVTRPAVLGDVALPATGGAESLYAVTGTAALVTEGENGAALNAQRPRTIRILNFADPLHPQVTREFTGVTATSRDERRGLIFVANGEGIWILHQAFAEDPEVEKAYAHHVVYDH
ncbi:MAG TPA: hypothetical protein VGL53_20725 [Bryobacteraceae bacterium]